MGRIDLQTATDQWRGNGDLSEGQIVKLCEENCRAKFMLCRCCVAVQRRTWDGTQITQRTNNKATLSSFLAAVKRCRCE